MSFLATSCALNSRKSSNYADYDNPTSTFSRMNRLKVKETSIKRLSQELEREKERVIKKISREDQKEIDGLQTTAQKRENVRKHVDEFIRMQEMEMGDMADQQQQLYNSKLNRENTMFADELDAFQRIRLDLFEDMIKEEDERFKRMMLEKFSEYDKICMATPLS